MSEFTELVKKFDKIRNYMRDFYVYGFKARNDFTQKSNRTYDNEKRRIQSYLEKYIIWDYSKKGKSVMISIDSAKISSNPLYSAWKTKSFTDNDILLHFYLIDILQHEEGLTIEYLTDAICYKSDIVFDSQTVRNKCNEYVKSGIFSSKKEGKKLIYTLNIEGIEYFSDKILNAIKFFNEDLPFGILGNTILDLADCENDLFCFKHHYVVHTLEDEVLLKILTAIKEKRKMEFINHSIKKEKMVAIKASPIKIFVSTKTGRRYACVYVAEKNRFFNYRLDYIKTVKILEVDERFTRINNILQKNMHKCWGVSFGNGQKTETFSMKLIIDEEKEFFVLDRLKREGRGGSVERLEKNVFLYKIEIYDSNEILGWVKTFTGRIIEVTCSNNWIYKKIHSDFLRMKNNYFIELNEERKF